MRADAILTDGELAPFFAKVIEYERRLNDPKFEFVIDVEGESIRATRRGTQHTAELKRAWALKNPDEAGRWVVVSLFAPQVDDIWRLHVEAPHDRHLYCRHRVRYPHECKDCVWEDDCESTVSPFRRAP